MRHRTRLVIVALSVVSTLSAGLVHAAHTPAATPDPLYLLQNLLQLFEGPLAPTTRFANDEYANPAFLPDWDHNGVYGDAGDVVSEQGGAPADAAFLYPCVGFDGSVTYETTTGACVPVGTAGVTFRRGLAHRFKLVDAFGLSLTATLWVPEAALVPGAAGFSGLVFSNGARVPQRSFYMYDMTAARAGFVVLSYDPVGQGTSQGEELIDMFKGARTGSCYTALKCRELQQLVRWFTGGTITRETPTLSGGDPAANPVNPALGVLDVSKIALAGQSNGGLAVSNYLELLPTGKDADGRPLPPIAAAVGLSGFAPASAVVPVQAQTADLDIPGVTADNLGLNLTDGPLGTKAWYEKLRASGQGNGMLQLLIQEGGSHGDTSNIPLAPHAVWAWAWSTGYFVDFLSCNVQHDAAACARAIAPRPHLSHAYASEYDPDGALGPSPSRCMSIPTKPSLEMVFDPLRLIFALLGRPPYNCTP